MPEPPAIVHVEAVHVRLPFRRPLLDATGEYTHRRSWIVRLTDERGRRGSGEATISPVVSDEASGRLDALVREVVPQLVGPNAPDERSLLAEGEPGRALLAAISGARADLAGNRANAVVPVSATIAFGGPGAGAEAAAQAVELGFTALELRAGAERRTDQLVDRLRAIRAAVGPAPRLRVDAAGAWDVDTATERLLAIEPYRIEFVEQPLAAWDVAGHATLRERVGVAIAVDETVESEGAAREILDAGAADVLVVRPVRVGGAAATRRIAEAAARRGVGIVVGTYFETGVGIAAALRIAADLDGQPPGADRRAHALATAGLLTHDLLRKPIAIDDGEMRVPGSLPLDEDELASRAIERVEVGRA